MKQLYAAVAIIGLLAGLSILHVRHLDRFTQDLIQQLETVSASLEEENWAAAKQTVRQVFDQWEDHAFYLHITLRHADIDDIRSSMKEILAYLDSQDDAAECQAVMARLINQLELLLEAEQPSIKNIL